MTVDRLPEILWTPDEHARGSTRIGRFLTKVEEDRDLDLPDYESAWSWSVEDLEGFWASVWDHFEIQASVKPQSVLSGRTMPGARWFEGALLNYAEHALRSFARDSSARDSSAEDPPVIIAHSQSRPRVALSAAELRDQVSRVRAGLMSLGVRPGDRVAAYMPNIPETVVLMLATAALGAVFSSCAPEFGARAVIDRFGQIEPSVLVAVDGYRYGERLIDKTAELEAIRAELPSLTTTVVLPYVRTNRADHPEAILSSSSPSSPSITWNELISEDAPLEFEQVPFDHPLYVLYSSGTTGLPKPIVHSHGGILLEHCKALGLMSDIGEDDRFFWFTTTGWMMWNYLVSGLAVGACLVLFDGDPSSPDLLTLWRLVEQERITWFGTSAPFLMACRKAGIRPGETLDLSSLKAVGSTGAPLPAEGAHWVYDAAARDIMLSSISGGTDVCTAFVGGCPIKEVRAGEIPCRWLGAAVEAYDEEGRSLVGSEGELVVTAPMPSMPVALWGDADGSRLRSTYFGTYPGVWRHGDWITLTERGSCVITGRSDATLNRGGVRMGTAELYSVVEDIAGVSDSLVVHVDDLAEGPGRLVLLVVPVAGDLPSAAGDDLSQRIKESLRSSLSPRHVPDEIHMVKSIPRTLSGKKLELPVKRILAGEDPRAVASREALVDPGALDAIVELAASRRARDQ